MITKHKFLLKRCENCDLKFNIPLFRDGSRAKFLAIDYTPCPHCHYVKDIYYKNFDKEGTCVDCDLPFTVVKYKARGRCHRCLMDYYRTNSTK